MIGALIIVFREVIEAGLIVGIVLAVTQGVHGSRLVDRGRRRGRRRRRILVAAFAGAIGDALAGIGQELFNASILAVAVVMLTWHNVWMASHGRQLAADVKQVGEAVSAGRARSSPSRVVCARRGDARRLRDRAVPLRSRRGRRLDRVRTDSQARSSGFSRASR